MSSITTMAAVEMGNTPVVVLVIYMIVLLTFGIVAYLKSNNSEEDYYLAGRGQGVLVTALTIMATFFSSAAMLGIPGLIYKERYVLLIFRVKPPTGRSRHLHFGFADLAVGTRPRLRYSSRPHRGLLRRFCTASIARCSCWLPIRNPLHRHANQSGRIFGSAYVS